MKRVKLDDNYFANVEEGTRARLDKATKRGMDPAQVQAISTFANKIRSTIDEHRDNIPTTSTNPTTPNTKKHEANLQVMSDQLSAIVSRVLKHRSETPRIVENIKSPPKKPTPTNEPSTKPDSTQIDGIFKIIHCTCLSRLLTLHYHYPTFHLQFKILYKKYKTC
jgi:hypothetical protein